MERKHSTGSIIAGVIMVILTLVLLPILIMNIILIAKGNSGGVVPPDIGGVAPLVVTTGSMDGDREDSFPEGSLIFVRILSDEEEKSQLAVDDVITYYLEQSDESIIYITHRIVAVNYADDGTVSSFITRGDANGMSNDPEPVTLSHVIGVYQTGIPVLGTIVEGLQNPLVIGLVIGIPIVAFIAYDVIRITVYNRKLQQQEITDKAMADKDEEIARLRALVGEQSASQAQPAPADSEPAEAVQESAPAEVEEVAEPEQVTEEVKEPAEPAVAEESSEAAEEDSKEE